MNQFSQIAERLKGLRDALDMTTDEMARSCLIPVDKYESYESGRIDIPVSLLQRIATVHGVELPTLMFGDEPKMGTYFVTRRGKGVSVERVKAYRYQALAAGFSGRRADPFIVTVHPIEADTMLFPNSHSGQEFNMVIEGCMTIHIDGKEIMLEEGDSIYFNAELPHWVRAEKGAEVRFLAVIF